MKFRWTVIGRSVSTGVVTILFLSSLLAKANEAAGEAKGPQPQVILFNGKILTVDEKDSIAEAVAIRDGKISAVGNSAEIRKLAGKETRLIDLHGRTVTPGLIDAHCHFDETAALYDITLSGIKNVSEAVELVKAKVAERKPGEWIQGAGWDEGKLAEQRYILASDLDKVAPNNPVWLTHTTGHYGVANSYALRLAKITSETQNPEAGTIDRSADGVPTGVLKESAMDLVTNLIPPYTKEQQRNGLLKIMADFNKEGMTAAKDPGITPERWELYREVLKDDKFSVRVFALLLGGTTVESAQRARAALEKEPRPPASLGEGLLFAGGVKMFMDGSGGGRTAWVYEPWHKKSTEIDTGNTGFPALDPAEYQKIVRLLHESGIHVSTHAVGDRAIDWVVDTYTTVLKEKPTNGLRHGIIHCNLPTDHAIATMAKLEKDYDAGYPEVQAPFMWWIGDNYAASHGAARSLRVIPLATFAKQGIPWAGGSDYFVTPFPARYGLWASVARRTLNGVYGFQPFGTAESVDIHTALRSYTIWAAHQLFLEKRVGSVEVGKDADLAVWDKDLYTIPTDELKELKCELTMFRGKIVYRAVNTPITDVPAN